MAYKKTIKKARLKKIAEGNKIHSITDVQLEKVAERINAKLGSVIERTDVLIDKLKKKPDYDKYYSDIEDAIIKWNIDGTKTAGTLTRQIIKILKKNK